MIDVKIQVVTQTVLGVAGLVAAPILAQAEAITNLEGIGVSSVCATLLGWTIIKTIPQMAESHRKAVESEAEAHLMAAEKITRAHEESTLRMTESLDRQTAAMQQRDERLIALLQKNMPGGECDR